MKLLFISDLKGNQQSYDFLISQAANFDVMLWTGNLTDQDRGSQAEQQALVERAYGAIQSRGCRVLACGGETDAADFPCHWMKRQGIFITHGLFITTMPRTGLKRAQLAAYREAAWNAGALWIVLNHGPIAPSLLTAGAPKSLLLWPNAALRFGPDVIVTSHAHSAKDKRAWCKRRGHTWTFNPGQSDGGEFPPYIVLDLRRWTAKRYSPRGSDERDVSVLRRIPSNVNVRRECTA